MSDNPKKLILFVKPWNSTGNRWCKTPEMELRFSSCACVYSQGKMCTVIDIVKYIL